MSKKGTELIMSEVMRGKYLVSQANELAKSFGKLSLFEHRVLDYCTSFVKKDDDKETLYTTNIRDMVEYFDLDSSSGANFKRLGNSLKKLKYDTPLLLPIYQDGDPTQEIIGVSMTELFEEINIMKTGEVTFAFSKRAQPLLFDLKKKFYAFKLEELSKLRSKYTIVLIKLWASYRRKGTVKTEDGKVLKEWKRETIIQASVEDWQDWFLGEGKRMEPARFRRDCLKVGMDELNEQGDVEASLKVIKKGRKVLGFEMTIVSDRGNNKRTIEGEVTPTPASNDTGLDQFFETFKKVTGVSAIKGQKAKTTELAEVFNADERLPILNFAQKLFVEYGGKTYAYLLKIVTDWSEAELKTLADVEAFYNADKTGTKAEEEPKTNVPKWSKPDYVNELSEEYIEKLIEFHKMNGTFETPEAQAEIAEKRAKRAELEAKKWELLGKLDNNHGETK